ncbi:DUF3152 domain-containing protein [Micromonospora mirobrigensis]|uniref:DUF3152 domain-containing protein n=1 Tax=Micromonospora mirobrigensis TaxID=262898 RepID=A0A1C4Y9Z1_9ACTN|nr:DUF3152 domain-containing protein [Micromonospora mirobrigensis]SCF17538.1 Protein of unknown function (DUF3152) [Micromonospora mirobrigensis]
MSPNLLRRGAETAPRPSAPDRDPVGRFSRSGPTGRWRRALFVAAVALTVLVGAGVAVAMDRPVTGTTTALPPTGSPTPSVGPAAGPFETGPIPSASGTPSVAPAAPGPVLRLPGPVPASGSGVFGYEERPGPVLGRTGVLRRFRVAVEAGSGEDVHAFAGAVQAALAGPGSWVDGGLRLQRVGRSAPADFTIFLATAGTAARLCSAGGVDIRVGGRPYTSCRVRGRVILNLDRWRTSVPHFVAAGVPLVEYRLYVVNHEVGHQLGHGHERCPGPGRPAPVMQQQTLFLDGCRSNPWPYRAGRRYAGPPV